MAKFNGFLTKEALERFLSGGNGSRGTVPLHADRGRQASVPVILEVPDHLVTNEVEDGMSTVNVYLDSDIHSYISKIAKMSGVTPGQAAAVLVVASMEKSMREPAPPGPE